MHLYQKQKSQVLIKERKNINESHKLLKSVWGTPREVEGETQEPAGVKQDQRHMTTYQIQ